MSYVDEDSNLSLNGDDTDNLKDSSSEVYIGRLEATISGSVYLSGKITNETNLKGVLTIPPSVEPIDTYHGHYEVTPAPYGTLTITENGTYDVFNYRTVIVNIS